MGAKWAVRELWAGPGGMPRELRSFFSLSWTAPSYQAHFLFPLFVGPQLWSGSVPRSGFLTISDFLSLYSTCIRYIPLRCYEINMIKYINIKK
jgi:hypothetical protein